MIIWFTGQPGSGKTTLARAMSRLVIDGDDLRTLMPNPGYDEAGRRQNIDRAQAIAAYLDRDPRPGHPVAVAVIAPYRDQREAFKATHNVVEVYLHTNEDRGRNEYHVADYEPPLENYLEIDTGQKDIREAVRLVRREMATASRGARMVDPSEIGPGGPLPGRGTPYR